MNRRALEQLRRSRTKVTRATGVPTLPDNVADVPIVITASHAFKLQRVRFQPGVRLDR